MVKRKEGFILLSVIIMAIIASIVMAVILLKIQDNMQQVIFSMEKLTLEKKAGDAFNTIYTYFRTQYHEKYVFDFNELKEIATPTWFDEFKERVASGTSLEAQSWQEVLSTFKYPFYSPQSSLQQLLRSVVGENVEIVLTPLNDFNNLLFVIARAESHRQVAYFFGFISPKYFTNWAVFALEGVNGYYSYGEIIDGPSYFGGNLGIQYKISKESSSGKYYLDFHGPFFNGLAEYGNLLRIDNTYLSLTGNGSVYVNGKYVGYGYVGPYNGMLNNKPDGKKWLIVASPYRLVEVQSVDLVSKNEIRVNGIVIDPNKGLIPDYFPAGGKKLSQSQKNDMYDYFNQINNLYTKQVISMTRDEENVFIGYANGKVLTNSASGIRLNSFTWTNGYYTFNEEAQNIKIVSDVMTEKNAEKLYNVSFPQGFSSPSSNVQVIEIQWKEIILRQWQAYERTVAQVIVTPTSELKNKKPPWDSITFFVYVDGNKRELIFPDKGAVPYKFNGVISAYGNVKIGGEGLPGGLGNEATEPTSIFAGKYTVISETGDVQLEGNILYAGLYNDLKVYIGKSLEANGIDLNALVKKDMVNSMLNVVALGGSIYIPYKGEEQTKNLIITANLMTFGSGTYTGNHWEKRGHLWIQDYQYMENEGYRQIFGSIISRQMDPTFTGGVNYWYGYKEYNVYDRRLYVNEDLPRATPQTNDVISFGVRMM